MMKITIPRRFALALIALFAGLSAETDSIR